MVEKTKTRSEKNNKTFPKKHDTCQKQEAKMYQTDPQTHTQINVQT